MQVWKRISFDAAHYLPDYAGPCANVHGHTYFVELGVQHPKDVRTGMVIDMTDLAVFLQLEVKERFDHKMLNDVIPNPTAENIAEYILERARVKYPGVEKIMVRVYETPTSWVEAAHVLKYVHGETT